MMIKRFILVAAAAMLAAAAPASFAKGGGGGHAGGSATQHMSDQGATHAKTDQAHSKHKRGKHKPTGNS